MPSPAGCAVRLEIVLGRIWSAPRGSVFRPHPAIQIAAQRASVDDRGNGNLLSFLARRNRNARWRRCLISHLFVERREFLPGSSNTDLLQSPLDVFARGAAGGAAARDGGLGGEAA